MNVVNLQTLFVPKEAAHCAKRLATSRGSSRRDRMRGIPNDTCEILRPQACDPRSASCTSLPKVQILSHKSPEMSRCAPALLRYQQLELAELINKFKVYFMFC